MDAYCGRPGGYLGYSPGEGPTSPKKKVSSTWLKAKAEREESLKAAPDIGKDCPMGEISLTSEHDRAPRQTQEEEEEEDCVEFEDDDSESNSEDSTSSYEDPADNGLLETLQNQAEASESSDDESEFDALPPPIDIPNELRPAHMRTAETTTTTMPPKFQNPWKNVPDSDSSDGSVSSDEGPRIGKYMPRPQAAEPESDSEESASTFPEEVEEEIIEEVVEEEFIEEVIESSESEPEPEPAPKPAAARPSRPMHAMRPGTMRGMSFDEDDAPIEKKQDEEPVRPTRRPPPHAMRPGTMRGMSFDDDDAPLEKKETERPTRRPESTPTSAPAAEEEEEDQEEQQGEYAWEKPEWAKKKKKMLKPTDKGQQLKAKGDLAKPITELPHMNKDGPFEKPEWTEEVKPKEGHRIQQDPAKPVTTLPQEVATGELDIGWAKPDWTKKSNLKMSNKGEAMKEGKHISRPIGGIKPVDA